MYCLSDFVKTSSENALITADFQKLIDRCASEGGGTIIVPPGTWWMGGVELCSNIHIVLEAGAILRGTAKLADYKLHDVMKDYPFDEGQDGVRAILYAHEKKNITIEGPGTIHGGGCEFENCGTRRARPRNMLYAGCENVFIRNLTLEESGFWNQHYLQCKCVRVDGVRVRSLRGINNDGIDIDSCKDVIVRNCRIDSQDDAICLKCSTDAPCENVLVADCITATHANHFKLGTESHGGFRNVRATNLVMVNSELLEGKHVGGGDYRGAAGIALGTVDGAFIENVVVENVTMDCVRVPIFLRQGDMLRSYPGMPPKPATYVKGVTLRRITAKGASAQGSYMIGLPDNYMKDIAIEDSSFEYEGGAPREDVLIAVPDDREICCTMDGFGRLSAFGVFMRYIDGLTLRNVIFTSINPEFRPAFRYECCKNVVIDNLRG